MKKFLLILVLLTVLVPMVASAQVSQCNIKYNLSRIDTACVPANNPINENDTKAWGLCCAMNAVFQVTDWIFVIIIIVVALLVIWGAFDIVTAAGSPDKVGSGRNRILYALIGLAIALLAKAIPAIVYALLGV